jgi:DNA gyrase subunit A
VRAVRLSEGDEVVGIIVSDEAPYVLIVTENGMGKRTRVEEFRAQSRGGVGVKCYKITPKTGELMGAMAVDTDDEIIIISTEGVIIRMSCENISVVGRITSGVRLMDLGEGD